MTHIKADDSVRVLVRGIVYKTTIIIILSCSIVPLILWHMRCINPMIEDCQYSIWWLYTKNYNSKSLRIKTKHGSDYNLNWMLENRKKSESLDLLAKGSFCTSKDTEVLGFLNSPFPLQLNSIPEDMLWVWDASFSDITGSYISILLVDNDICPYNRTRFLSDKNDFMKEKAKENLKHFLNSTTISKDSLKSKLFCRYYDKRSHLLGTVVSTKVLATTKDEYYANDINDNDKYSFKTMKNIYIVRCPVPAEYKDKSPLQIRMQIPPFSPLLSRNKAVKDKLGKKAGRSLLQVNNNKDMQKVKGITNNNIIKKQGNQLFTMTKMFPICPYAVKKKAIDSPKHRLFNISLCTALKDDDKDEVVEWIEQHRVLGVEHIFMFDNRDKTNRQYDDDDDIRRIDEVLYKYVKSGILTLIPWSFSNCDNDSKDNRVEKITAESSCFLRFRSASQWIGFIPLNEMIVMKLDHSVGGSILTDLPNFISFMERKTKGDLSAIGFRKNPMIKCLNNNITTNSSLPVEDIALSKNQQDEEEMIPPPRLGIMMYSPSIKKLKEANVGVDTKSKGYLLKMDAILTAVQNDFILLDDNLGHRLGLFGRRNEDGEGYTIGDGAVFLRKISYATGKDITFEVQERSKSTDATYTIAEITSEIGGIMNFVSNQMSEKLKSITCEQDDTITEKFSIYTKERVSYRMSLALEGIISETNYN